MEFHRNNEFNDFFGLSNNSIVQIVHSKNIKKALMDHRIQRIGKKKENTTVLIAVANGKIKSIHLLIGLPLNDQKPAKKKHSLPTNDMLNKKE